MSTEPARVNENIDPDQTRETEDPQGSRTAPFMSAKSTQDTFKLPCGWIDEDDEVHKDATYSEITGVEEEIIAGKGDMAARLTQVIANCLKDIGGRKGTTRIVREMTMIDRVYSLIALRRVSLGDELNMKIKCPDEDCGFEEYRKVNLAKLEVKYMKDPKVRNFTIMLPSSGIEVAWHVQTGHDEEWLAKQRRRLKGQGRMTLGIMSRIDMFGEEKWDRERKTDVGKMLARVGRLGLRDRNALRYAFQAEGDIDTNLEFTCENCGIDFEFELALDTKDFFFPSEM